MTTVTVSYDWRALGTTSQFIGHTLDNKTYNLFSLIEEDQPGKSTSWRPCCGVHLFSANDDNLASRENCWRRWTTPLFKKVSFSNFLNNKTYPLTFLAPMSTDARLTTTWRPWKIVEDAGRRQNKAFANIKNFISQRRQNWTRSLTLMMKLLSFFSLLYNVAMSKPTIS